MSALKELPRSTERQRWAQMAGSSLSASAYPAASCGHRDAEWAIREAHLQWRLPEAEGALLGPLAKRFE
jgi:hypothetical protein